MSSLSLCPILLSGCPKGQLHSSLSVAHDISLEKPATRAPPIAGSPTIAATPRWLMTSAGQSNDSENLRLSGFEGRLLKPISLRDLRACLGVQTTQQLVPFLLAGVWDSGATFIWVRTSFHHYRTTSPLGVAASSCRCLDARRLV